jgi:hypothetical protein
MVQFAPFVPGGVTPRHRVSFVCKGPLPNAQRDSGVRSASIVLRDLRQSLRRAGEEKQVDINPIELGETEVAGHLENLDRH